MELGALLMHAVFFGFASAWLAVRKRYRPLPWFILGMLFGAIAIVLLYLQPSREREREDASVSPAR
jgi:hypothetical protein